MSGVSSVKRWILRMRYTVRDESGRAVAFILASTPVEMLQSFWSQAPVIAKASIALVRDDGYLINRYPVPPGTLDTELYGKPRDGAVFRFIRAQRWPAQGQFDGPNALAGEAFSSVFKRLERFPVTLVAGVSMSEIRAGWWSRVRVPFLCGQVCDDSGHRHGSCADSGACRWRPPCARWLRAQPICLDMPAARLVRLLWTSMSPAVTSVS